MSRSKKKDEQKVHLFSWQRLESGNITFADELDFDIEELALIKQDQLKNNLTD